jgi:tetratricopeptide (TPR) repeat protein
VALSLAGLLGATFLLVLKSRTDIPQKGQLAILSHATLRQTLIARGATGKDVIDPFEGSKVSSQLVTSTDQNEKARARAIAKALGVRLKGVAADLDGADLADVRPPGTLAAALVEKRLKSALSFELSALLTATLRKAKLAALLCTARTVDASMPSPDPTGALSRYVVAVFAEGKLDKEPLVVFDPVRATACPAWAGRGEQEQMIHDGGAADCLDDGSAAGHLMALRALLLAREEKQRPTAFELSRLALRVSAQNGALRVARAMVLLQSGGVKDALEEAQAAVGIQDDPARRTAHARLLLINGQAAAAVGELEIALKQDEHYWPAHQIMTSLRWFGGDREKGDAHLDKALKLAPNEPGVLQLQATRFMTENKFDESIRILRRLLEQKPDERVLLQLYLCLRKTKADDEAKKIEARLLKESKDQEQTKKALASIRAMLEESPKSDDEPGTSPAPSSFPKAPRLTLPDVSLGKP